MSDKKATYRKCEHPGCVDEGLYRAPKTRDLSDYWWFCLKHAGEYNKSWNYYDGMSTEQIEAENRRDETWRTQTFRFGLSLDRLARNGRLEDPFGIYEKFVKGGAPSARRRAPAKPLSGKERAALSLFSIPYPFAMAGLRARYRKLVKLHHPDVNGGSKEHEEAFKEIVAAYSVLLKLAE
ncbi:MAG: J domain-containing protein [Rickettsiales bacterium]|jgi:curved DNA-binding protein CbpA|nr:J domain-containing protein [Rickettsiales bacterium]